MKMSTSSKSTKLGTINPPVEDLPPGGVVKISRTKGGRKYYYNPAMKISTWTRPGQDVSREEKVSKTQASSKNKSCSSSNRRVTGKRKLHANTQHELDNPPESPGKSPRKKTACVIRKTATQTKTLNKSLSDNSTKGNEKSLKLKSSQSENSGTASGSSEWSNTRPKRKGHLGRTDNSTSQVCADTSRTSERKGTTNESAKQKKQSIGNSEKQTRKKAVAKRRKNEYQKRVDPRSSNTDKSLPVTRSSSSSSSNFNSQSSATPKSSLTTLNSTSDNSMKMQTSNTSISSKTAKLHLTTSGSSSGSSDCPRSKSSSLANFEGFKSTPVRAWSSQTAVQKPASDLSLWSQHSSGVVGSFSEQHFSLPPPLYDDDVESMEVEEWSQEEEEQMIGHIQTMRDNFQTDLDARCGQLTDITHTGGVKGGAEGRTQLYVVLDTNVLISHLKIVEELRDENIPGLGRPILVIPWVVMQELDLIKDNKKKLISSGTERNTRLAVKFLHACFVNQHPRVVGQTPQEASKKMGNLRIEVNDDRVIHCCLQYKEKYPNSHVILFSNDTNLCTKCLISGVQALTKQELQGGLKDLTMKTNMQISQEASAYSTSPHIFHPPALSQSTNQLKPRLSPQRCVSSPVIANVRKPAVTVSRTEGERILADDIDCEVKTLVRDVLSVVLETEMKKAYGDIWVEIVYRKPPWTVKDVLDCFIKHWIAVFGMFLPRNLEQEVKSLSLHYKSCNTGRNLADMKSILGGSRLILEDIKVSRSEFQERCVVCIQRLKTLENICRNVINGNLAAKRLQDFDEDSQHSNKIQAIQSQSVHGAITRSMQNSQSECTDNTNTDGSMEFEAEQGLDNQNVLNETFGAKVLDAQTEMNIFNKFQQIWGSIHTHSEMCMKVLSIPQGSPHPENLPSKQQVVTLLKKLYPAIQQLKVHFLSLLSVPIGEIEQSTLIFKQICHTINNFLQATGIQAPQPNLPILPENLKLYYLQSQRREELKNGLLQLNEMIEELRKCLDRLL